MSFPVHVKFGFAEAVNSKKQLLAGQIDILEIARKLNNYKRLRKLEIELRSALGLKVKALEDKLNKLMSLFPEVEMKNKGRKRIQRISRDKHLKKTIEGDLKEIHERLARLG